MAKRGKTLKLVFAALILIATVLLFMHLSEQSDARMYSTSFDAKLWQESARQDGRKGDNHYRQDAAKDLIDRQLLDGKTRNEVIELLGEPEDTVYFKQYDMVYYLGAERGMGVDSDWLVIKLIDDHVSEYKIATD